MPNFCQRSLKLPYKILKVNLFQKRCLYIEGFHFYKVNIHFFKNFLNFFSKYFLLKLKLFRHNSYYHKDLPRNSPKIGKNVGTINPRLEVDL